MKEIIGNLLKKENERQNLSSLRQEIKDENALVEALKLLAGEDELLVSFMGAEDAKTRKNAALLIGDLHMSQLSDEVFKASFNLLYIVSFGLPLPLAHHFL